MIFLLSNPKSRGEAQKCDGYAETRITILLRPRSDTTLEKRDLLAGKKKISLLRFIFFYIIVERERERKITLYMREHVGLLTFPERRCATLPGHLRVKAGRPCEVRIPSFSAGKQWVQGNPKRHAFSRVVAEHSNHFNLA